jgi:hypothetical protein
MSESVHPINERTRELSFMISKPPPPWPSPTTVSGSAAFIGTVYAPEAAFTFSGASGASGSFTGNTVAISGGASVHYDEGLSNAGQGYVVMSWNEF